MNNPNDLLKTTQFETGQGVLTVANEEIEALGGVDAWRENCGYTEENGDVAAPCWPGPDMLRQDYDALPELY